MKFSNICVGKRKRHAKRQFSNPDSSCRKLKKRYLKRKTVVFKMPKWDNLPYSVQREIRLNYERTYGLQYYWLPGDPNH